MNQHHFTTMFLWDALNVNADRTKVSLRNTETCSNHEFLREHLRSYWSGRNVTQEMSRGLTTWKDVRKSAQKGIVLWQTRRRSNCGQFQRFAWMDEHNFKKEELEIVGELSKVWSQIVWRCLYLALIGRLNILWSVHEFARTVTKWTRACDRVLARLIFYIHPSVPRLRFCW